MGPLYTINALQWRYRQGLTLYTVEHPAATDDALRTGLAARGVEFATCDLTAEPIPWPDAEFDLIFLSEVIEHIPPTLLPGYDSKDCQPALVEGRPCDEQSKPSGHLVCSFRSPLATPT